ncbi:cobalamin biosynthesis protein [Gordonia phage Gmala1]|uniref:von Willebrand factor domain protein n=1 Tax=Gordonia phage Gmala1 TaxID=1622190 RepID=A0A0E3T6P2_9CAUD|nr:cobalamin biosynthesis protein [Gordonia phage Gmala1]AKC02919.1 von Willebrand factor domain protein [Gordonia phage Gmala1]
MPYVNGQYVTKSQLNAEKAIKEFRRISTDLTRFANAAAKAAGVKRPNFQVVAGKNTATDGKKIYVRPPVSLARNTQHDYTICEIRDEKTGLMICEACEKWEEIYSGLYHEISHCVNGSFDKLAFKSLTDTKNKFESELKAAGVSDDFISGLSIRFLGAMRNNSYSYAGAQEFVEAVYKAAVPMVLVVEDTRIDYIASVARPGLTEQRYFQGENVLNDGISLTDGTKVLWKNMPVAAQIQVGILFKTQGHEIDGRLNRRAVEIVNALDEMGMLYVPESLEETAMRAVILSAVICEMSQGEFFPHDDYTPPKPETTDDSDEKQDSQADQADNSDQADQADSSESGESAEQDSGDTDSVDSEQDSQDESADNADSSDSDQDSQDESDSAQDGNSGDSDQDSQDDGDSGDSESSNSEQDLGDSEQDSGDTDSGDSDQDSDADDSDADDSDNADNSAEHGTGDISESGDGNHGEEDSDSDSDSEQDNAESASQGDNSGMNAGNENSKNAGQDAVNSEQDSDDDSETVEVSREDLEKALQQALGHAHAEKDDSNHDENSDQEFDMDAIDPKDMDRIARQSEDFDSISVDVNGVKTYSDQSGYGSSYIFDRDNPRHAINEDNVTSVMAGALLKAKRVFGDSKKDRYERNLKTGRVSSRSLSRFAYGDDRLFQKRHIAEGVDFDIIVGLDVSGSTSSMSQSNYGKTLLSDIKSAGFYIASLFHKTGVNFGMYAHTFNYDQHDDGYLQQMIECKALNKPWDDKAQQMLKDLRDSGGSLDGHNLEFYRKKLERSRANKKMIIYFTDGKIPEQNTDEEEALILREIENCKRLGISVLCVGMMTDSPKKFGFDTVLMKDSADMKFLLSEIEKRIL